ncbi:alpha/beta fold hydrolase [Psychromonas sp.]|uniref:alpha/beta fold hydrolase n=1 Tax=Psychromonas sp. TaxID=1884585 RepID=UPI0039E6ACE5
MTNNIKIYANDGREINLYQWLPEGKPLKVILLSHGMGEHIERYADFATACNQNGIAVIAANHRGHGPDAPILGYFAETDGWDLVLSDIARIVKHITDSFTVNPILFGHSMGSFVARHYASKHGKSLSGLVLCGSNHQGGLLVKVGLLAAKLERMRIGKSTPSAFLDKLSFGDFNKKIKPLRTKQDWLCRDPKIVDQFLADPYCGFICTPQFWIDFLGGLNEMSKTKAFKAIPKNLPIYLISGDADPVSRYGAGLSELKQKLLQSGSRNVTAHLYAGARHELLNEVNREEIYTDLFNWLNKID